MVPMPAFFVKMPIFIIFVSDEDSSPMGVNDYINAFRDVKGSVVGTFSTPVHWW